MFEGAQAVGLSVLTAFICFNASEIGGRLGVIDRPDRLRKHHAVPTPLMGGLAVLAPFLLLVAFYRALTEAAPVLLAILIVAGGFTVIGFLDDRRDLSPRLRLAAGILFIAGAVLTVSGQHITALDFGGFVLPLGMGVGFGFTILVVLGLINAVNMADGKNGIVPGSALIWTLCLAAYSPPSLESLMLVLGALLAVVLAFNLRGKLFLGDAGAYGLAALFSVLTIDFYNRSEALTADIVIAWFIVPVIDCIRLMVCRTLRGGSPFRPDRDHLHHRLQAIVPANYVFLLYWALIAIPSAGAMAAPSWSFVFIGGVVTIYAAIIMLTSKRFAVAARTGRRFAFHLARFWGARSGRDTRSPSAKYGRLAARNSGQGHAAE